MALGGLAVAFIVVDTLLRRLVLPIVLLTSVIVRYNLISFAYLLLLLVIFLLPGPRLKSQKVTNIVYLSVLLVLSGVATLVQVFFQIALATSYKNELNSGCGATESIWRQIGFVLFNVPAIDVIRLLLPDVIVFVASLLTLVVDVFVVIKLRPPTTTATEGEGGANGGTAENDNKEPTEIEARHVDSETGAADGALSPHSGPPYPKNIQCYWEVPKLISYIIEFGIFVMLGLAGIAVPSITSFSYYAVFLVLLVIWSVHMRLAGLVRVLRTLLTLHSALHLLMLHLFQFSTAQDHFQLMPGECNTTISNQMARLFGLTPIITTDCFRPTELLLCSNINYTVFLNPAFVFILYWLLATDFRMWLFTPKLLWRKEFSYYLPIQDESPSKSVKCVLKKNSRRSQILEGSRSYGTMGPSLLQEGTDSDANAATPSPDLVAPVLTTKEKLQLKETVWFRVKKFALGLWAAVLSITFIFTVVAMMFWSVLYPSWPSLVFLLWSCGIWLIPKLNPRDSVFYTSPVLVAYSFILLLIQYVYSLDLTMEEFRKSNDIVLECSLGRRVGCKSIALLAKTLFTVIFFASFHEFDIVRVMKIKIPRWWAKRKRQADGEMPLAEMHDDEDADSPNELTDSTKANEEARSNIYLSMIRLLRTYWVLAVVGAFLLVTLTGEPSALKSVYLICFFIFMITYQIAARYWFYFCLPVWWLLVFYAAVHLILIYTFPFTNHLWMNAYNDLFHPNDSISADELFKSIGFSFLEYNDIHFRTLIVTLVPPAVFIAVMALQLRFFKPRLSVATAGAQVASQAAIDIYSILPKAFRDTLSKLDEVDFGEDPDDDEDDGDDDDNGEDSDEITLHRRSPSMYSIKSSALRETHPKLYSCYRFTRYLFHKTRQIIVDLNTIFWRFMELHLHKIVVLVLFATSVSQINAAYWVLLVLALIVVPLPYFNTLTYPIITLYLGLLCTAKMVYNLPVMSQYYLNFTESPRQCEPIVNKVEGLVYQSIYSPLFNDTNWVGLHPAEDFAHYISLPIVCVLLLSFWFSARRYQARHYESQKIVVSDYEHRSLFLHVTRAEAEVSIVASLKYLVNHFFEMYGIEVCWGMLAIAVAVRIDVYGMIYAVVLGLLFLVPRFILRPIWLVYLPLHGVLLAIQYFFLLGAPPSICYNKPNTTVYPWSNLDISDNRTHFSPSAFKKWLFIPDDTREILNSHLLYADFLVYIVVCLQLMYFFRNPLEQGTRDQVDRDIPNFYEARYWIDYFKVFVFQYSFWFSLFLLFFTAAYRVSLFGIFYLLVGFYFLFRGQQMLRDRQRARHTKWSVLRFVTWITLLVRVSLQILDCVFWEKVQIFKGIDNCLLILLFNGACTKQPYYGSALPNCPDEPRNLGLWIDALNFIIISLQIIIFDTDYAEKVRDELTRRVNEAQSFREIFDSKIKEYQEAQQKKKTKEIEELVERTEKLVVSEKKIDHLLYAGVRVPEDIEIRRTRRRTSTSTSKAEEDVDLVTSTSISQDITTGERERSTAKKLYDQLVEVVDWVIEQLEQGSSLYREVVFSIKESQSPTRASRESEPIALEGRTRYGSTDAPPQQPATTEVHVEVHEEAGTQDGPKAEAGDQGDKPPTEKESKKKKKKKMKKSKSVGFDVPTPTTGDTVIDELHIEPSVSQREEIEKFEGELEEKALKVTSRLRRLSTAIYYFLLAHSDYLVFFFIILNIILNGSVLSMVYAILLYTWGLLSIPWPTRKFWLTLIFYTMFVLVIKYAFQFHDITYWEDKFDRSSGLYPPLVLGILHRKNFFTNAVWDILLLITLLLHRGLLVQYGLWSAGPHQGIIKSFTNIFKQLWHDVKEFFTRLFDPDISQGAKDYYAVMLFFDLLCFLTIVAGVNSFGIGIQTRTVADLTAVADFVRTNNVPLLFVALLLLQFVSMVVDRAIYLRRSLPARFVFQVFLLIGWHVGLFFVLPSDPLTGRPFTSNAAAQCLYFFKSCYFIASSLQIVSGYPARILGYLLTSSYNMVAWLAFLVYRLIPLLPELRETMDWTFTDTSLSLINWFKVQEIYSLIYLVKVQRTREKSYPRDLGQKQSWLVKIFAGGLVLIGLILLIWLPLLLISVIGQASEPNPPVEVDIKLSIGGFQPLVELTVQERGIYKLSESDYKRLGNLFSDIIPFPVFLREFQQDDFRRVVFPGESTSLWTISPPSREQLKVQLENIVGNPNLTLPLDFSWSIKRAPSSSSNVLETVSGITTQQLSSNSSAVKEFTDSLNSNMPSNVLVNLTNLYPTLIHAPSSQQSTNFSQLSNLINNGVSSNVSCTAILNRTGNASEEGVSEWWSLTQNSSYVVTPQIPGQLEMIIYSERVAPQIFSFISGLGIITLYVSVVLVIGRFIRTYVADLPYRLAVDEILNPDPLIRLCQDIYTVRERKDLRLEEILVGRLFYIFRSPERIVRITEDLKEKTD